MVLTYDNMNPTLFHRILQYQYIFKPWVLIVIFCRFFSKGSAEQESTGLKIFSFIFILKLWCSMRQENSIICWFGIFLWEEWDREQITQFSSAVSLRPVPNISTQCSINIFHVLGGTKLHLMQCMALISTVRCGQTCHISGLSENSAKFIAFFP